MKYLKILIISGSNESFHGIQNNLVDFPFMCTYQRSNSFKDTLSNFLDFSPNIIIVDYDFLDSVDLLMLQTISSTRTSIIVISENSAKAVYSYASGVIIDFVLRPYSNERLILAINRGLRVLMQFNAKIIDKGIVFLQQGRVNRRFILSDIVFIEAYGTYVKVHTEKGKYIVNEGISKIEVKLSHWGFIRIHKSYVINLENVHAISSSQIEVSLCTLPIGNTYRETIESQVGIFR